METSNFKIHSLSESSLAVVFGNTISKMIQRDVIALAQAIRDQPFVGFLTTVPAYTTLTIFFDPIEVALSDMTGKDAFEKVSAYLQSCDYTSKRQSITENDRQIIIPVCYDNDLGPDIDEVAELHQLSATELIRLHTQVVYEVYMIGFTPGFAYLGGMSELLSTPRKKQPRKAVPAGSVGIAGAQTGIYPLKTPGGWQIIGRTPLKMFDAEREQPSLLSPGDRLIFRPIDREEFNYLAGN